MTDLDFTRLQPPSTDLAFGESGGQAVYIDITLTAVLVSAPLTASLPLDLDNAVSRGPASRIGAAWQPAAPAAHAVATRHQAGTRRVSVVAQPVTDAGRLSVAHAAGWGRLDHMTAAPATAWRAGARNATVSAENWANLNPRLRPGLRAVFEAGTPRAARTSDAWISLLRDRRPETVLPWSAARPLAHRTGNPFAPAIRHRRNTRHPWGETTRPAAGKSPHDSTAQPPAEPPCYIPPLGNAVALALRNRQPVSFDLAFECSHSAPAQTVVIPILRSYLVINDIALVRRSNSLALPVLAMSVNIDVDAWTWGWQASLPASCLDDVLPAGGAPVEFEAVVNGVHWYLLGERVTRDRSFPQGRITVSGRGIAAELGAPYAQRVSRSNATDLSAQQLVTAALQINEGSIGWDVDWQLTDWLVPAGVWSHQGSHIEAVTRIAETAGAYVQADRIAKTLAIKPRYPVAPWDWGSVTPDFSLPSSATSKEGIEWIEQPNYNAVFVRGEGVGVLGHVIRAGSAGDLVAPMVVDALMTHADAVRQRSTRVLGDTGQQQRLTLETPILSGVGIYPVGAFVEFTDGAESRLGLVRSLAISAGKQVRQTIEVECHA